MVGSLQLQHLTQMELVLMLPIQGQHLMHQICKHENDIDYFNGNNNTCILNDLMSVISDRSIYDGVEMVFINNIYAYFSPQDGFSL